MYVIIFCSSVALIQKNYRYRAIYLCDIISVTVLPLVFDSLRGIELVNYSNDYIWIIIRSYN